MSNPDDGPGVASRGDRRGSVGSVAEDGVDTAMLDGRGLASRGDRRRSAGLGAGEQERVRDLWEGSGSVDTSSTCAGGTFNRLVPVSPSCEF